MSYKPFLGGVKTIMVFYYRNNYIAYSKKMLICNRCTKDIMSWSLLLSVICLDIHSSFLFRLSIKTFQTTNNIFHILCWLCKLSISYRLFNFLLPFYASAEKEIVDFESAFAYIYWQIHEGSYDGWGLVTKMRDMCAHFEKCT